MWAPVLIFQALKKRGDGDDLPGNIEDLRLEAVCAQL